MHRFLNALILIMVLLPVFVFAGEEFILLKDGRLFSCTITSINEKSITIITDDQNIIWEFGNRIPLRVIDKISSNNPNVSNDLKIDLQDIPSQSLKATQDMSIQATVGFAKIMGENRENFKNGKYFEAMISQKLSPLLSLGFSASFAKCEVDMDAFNALALLLYNSKIDANLQIVQLSARVRYFVPDAHAEPLPLFVQLGGGIYFNRGEINLDTFTDSSEELKILKAVEDGTFGGLSFSTGFVTDVGPIKLLISADYNMMLASMNNPSYSALSIGIIF